MRQIVYFSTAAGRQDAIVNGTILVVSRERNRRDGITGLLVAGGLRYLQVIEGPPTAIEALLRRLRADDRHLAMSILVDRRTRGASFPGWSMAYAESPALADFATLRDLAGVMWGTIPDAKLRAQVDCFVRTFATPPRAPALTVDGGH